MGLPDSSTKSERASDVESVGGGSAVVGQETDGQPHWLTQPSDDLQDHRRRGEWRTRYDRGAWLQIAIEFSYLFLILVVAAVGLTWIGYYVAPPSPEDARSLPLFNLAYPRDRSFLLWAGVGLSGIAGGASFALKWLYHSVAKWSWNRDRILWRLVVPPLSGTLAVFVGLMISSEVVSFLNAKFFDNFYGAIGAGYFIGYFSDNVLAALQNTAGKWFGTVDKAHVRRKDDRPAIDDPGADAR